MDRSIAARLLALVVLLAALGGLLVWHGSLNPAPEAGAFPGTDEIAADADEYVGERVTVGGRIVETDPVVIAAEYGVGEELRIGITDPPPSVTVRKGATLRVHGDLVDARTVRARNAFVVPNWGAWYGWTISFLAGLWVLGRIVRYWRFDRTGWGLRRREQPLGWRSLRGGEEDA
jgi:hypothetical protein